MILKALDLLRELGWGVIKFIYDLIDGIYDIINEINKLDIVGTLSNNKVFTTFYTSVITIALTIFALTVAYRFTMKVLEPTEGPSINHIVTEILKCGAMLLMSTFLFVQVSDFSINLSGYVSNIITSETNTSLGTAMKVNYITYSENYKKSNDFANDDYSKSVKDGSFDALQKYNDKFTVKEHFIRSDDKDYKYSINWIMAILVGSFFAYAMCFSAIMLGRRQIEFLFLFLIAPIIFATSICSKQRRGALIEQLVSLLLQSAVIVLIINITVLIMSEIESSTFFDVAFLNIAMKSLLYVGCATFLMTGSQVINRFVGANVSANSGRENLMSLMGFGKYAKAAGMAVAGAGIGAGIGAVGIGMKAGGTLLSHSNTASKVGRMANNILDGAGNLISMFGKSVSGDNNTSLADDFGLTNPISSIRHRVGNSISNLGASTSSKARLRNEANAGIGFAKGMKNKGSSMFNTGKNLATPNIIRRFNYYNNSTKKGG